MCLVTSPKIRKAGKFNFFNGKCGHEKMFQTTRLWQNCMLQLTPFLDASQNGYGQVSYLRLVDEKRSIHCCLVMGKSRVAPTKFVSIPRLELTAAALSVKVSY